MKKTTRRTFIKTGALGLGAAALGSRRVLSAAGGEKVAYRELGSTGLSVSEVGFGAMNMRDPELVHAAIDSGINYIDTANSYMNGENEKIVGQVMKDRRDEVVLTTKIKWRNPENMPGMIDDSLERLQTDHVDILLMHVTESRDTILDERLQEIFINARDAGKARFIGVSTHSNQAEVLDAAVESGVWEAVLVGYNVESPPEVGEAIINAREAGLAIIGMKNLLNPATWPWEPVKDIRESGSEMSEAQALIKWVLENPGIDTTIPGMTNFEQLAEDVAIMGMEMDIDGRRDIEQWGGQFKGHYCCGPAGCTGCQDQCPRGVRVHDINRCLMYVHGYGDERLAWENYRDIPRESRVDICGDCDECMVQCVNGIDISANIREAQRLFG